MSLVREFGWQGNVLAVLDCFASRLAGPGKDRARQVARPALGSTRAPAERRSVDFPGSCASDQ
eukprot:9213691-Pyramimonas_sp.AAC.1